MASVIRSWMARVVSRNRSFGAEFEPSAPPGFDRTCSKMRGELCHDAGQTTARVVTPAREPPDIVAAGCRPLASDSQNSLSSAVPFPESARSIATDDRLATDSPLSHPLSGGPGSPGIRGPRNPPAGSGSRATRFRHEIGHCGVPPSDKGVIETADQCGDL